MTTVEVRCNDLDVDEPRYYCRWQGEKGISLRQANILANQHVHHTGHTVLVIQTITKEVKPE